MAKYAAKTEVTVEKSQAAVLKVLKRYGATDHMVGEYQGMHAIGFKMKGRNVRILLPKPDPKSSKLRYDGRGYARTIVQQRNAYDQAEKQAWRALLLIITAKLEYLDRLVDNGVGQMDALFEQVFLADIVTPNGQTMGEVAAPALKHAYSTGIMPPLLPPAR